MATVWGGGKARRRQAERPTAQRSVWPVMLGYVAAIAALTVTCAIAVQLGARLLVRHKGPLDPVDSLNVLNDARSSLVQVLGGIGLLGGFIYTIRTFALSRETQRNDRLSKAIDQIGSESSEAVRAGGAYGLEILAKEADIYWPVVEDVLTALIRERATPGSKLAADVQASLTVLGRRPARRLGAQPPRLDLRNVDISGANLTAA